MIAQSVKNQKVNETGYEKLVAATCPSVKIQLVRKSRVCYF